MGFLSKVNEARKKVTQPARSVFSSVTGGLSESLPNKIESGLDSAFKDVSGKTVENAIKEAGGILSQGALEGSNLRADELLRGADIAGQGLFEGGQITSDALLAGGNQFADTSRQGLDLLRSDLSPFANAFGAEDISRLKSLATDPSAQASFVTDNPFFEALKSQAKENTFRTQSGAGALGSSGTDEMLQNSFLAQGQSLIDKQINRALPLLSGAQSAATNLGQGSANILGNIAGAQNQALAGSGRALGQATAGQQGILGDAIANAGGFRASGLEDSAQALATGQIGSANAGAAGTNNVISLLSGLGGLFV